MKQRQEDGFVTVLFVLFLPALLAVAGFALSLCNIYLQANRIQNAADAGATAGSVYLPQDPEQAYETATKIARENGQPTDIITPSHENTTQTVKVTRTVQGIFLFPAQTLTRTAHAQYRPYVPMGNPGNCLGCAGGEHYWLNISAAGTDKATGDRYSSGGPQTNTDYQPQQEYVWRIKQPGYHKLELYDPQFTEQGDNCTIANCTGDHQTDTSKTKPPTSFTIKTANGSILYTKTFQPNDSTTYLRWSAFVSQYLSAGDYLLHVSNSSSTNYNGLNRFAIRTDANTSIFAKGRLVIYAKDSAADTTFAIARVTQAHAGQQLHIDLFDIADAGGSVSLQVLPPTDSNKTKFTCTDDSDCTYTGLTNATQNGKTKQITARIPADYTCNAMSEAGCYIRLRIQYPSTVNDTTSWTVYADGTPVHLLQETE